ncbi:hypothetical protein NDU88_004609 [Pleurodeles waltl]|uniref:Uncharacterized protein n=1 Tax=Pleurodeles waltl TaxID=8319 RepID=A0AAV7VHJ7_PLEWA|nr:hypothetical protein NDU88_004609 [Pleurodeles waltl]
MPPLPQVSRSNSQHQVAARADTYIHSARVASHLEADVSRRPVTAHGDTKPVQRQGPGPGAPAPSAAFAAAAPIHLCGAPRVRSQRFRGPGDFSWPEDKEWKSSKQITLIRENDRSKKKTCTQTEVAFFQRPAAGSDIADSW